MMLAFSLQLIRDPIRDVGKEGDGIYAFKTHYDRFLCFFFEGAKVIVTMHTKRQAIRCLMERKANRYFAEKIIKKG